MATEHLSEGVKVTGDILSVATLTAAIQEQQVIIDALKARLDTAGI
jgi:hypothetical protein